LPVAQSARSSGVGANECNPEALGSSLMRDTDYIDRVCSSSPTRPSKQMSAKANTATML